jgi:hypothetical protein
LGDTCSGRWDTVREGTGRAGHSTKPLVRQFPTLAVGAEPCVAQTKERHEPGAAAARLLATWWRTTQNPWACRLLDGATTSKHDHQQQELQGDCKNEILTSPLRRTNPCTLPPSACHVRENSIQCQPPVLRTEAISLLVLAVRVGGGRSRVQTRLSQPTVLHRVQGQCSRRRQCIERVHIPGKCVTGGGKHSSDTSRYLL